ncbi:MAG: endonuclease Q family protein [Candidatus Heimdallarchaeota archaeon]
MDLAVDLHAHSIFAGGTHSLKLTPERIQTNKKKALSQLKNITQTMPLKGIDIIGTGDCQFSFWNEILKKAMTEDQPGFFYLNENDKTRFILQTELIFTAPIGRRSKIVHMVFLFPDFSCVEVLNQFLKEWGVKYQKMARPFIKCGSIRDVATRIHAILDINPLVEAIPAHIMTPQGIFGSNIRVNHLSDFFGSVTSRLQIFETGLSADPNFLGLIPELDDRVFISSSDAHSGALHRMGREYTIVSSGKKDYRHLIHSLRNKNIIYTAEFPPEEGRFFLTGHRSGRKKPGFHGKDEWCCFSPQYAPQNDICPICHKALTIGVYQRCTEIGKVQGEERDLTSVIPTQKFIRMVPLVEIIAHVLGLKTKTAKSIIEIYRKIVDHIGPERNLWTLATAEVQGLLKNIENQISSSLLDAILEVKRGNFTFVPYGFDGVYGTLQIGNKGNYRDVNVVNSSNPLQSTLPH